MAAYRRVYDSRHLQADCQEPGSAPEPLRSVIEYGLPLPFYMLSPAHRSNAQRMCEWPLSPAFAAPLYILSPVRHTKLRIVLLGIEGACETSHNLPAKSIHHQRSSLTLRGD